MYFIVGLPKSGNKSVIMVVVDHLSRYAHLCALQHPFIASNVAQLFMDHIFKLHGMPHGENHCGFDGERMVPSHMYRGGQRIA
jgi:hypothetical protein